MQLCSWLEFIGLNAFDLVVAVLLDAFYIVCHLNDSSYIFFGRGRSSSEAAVVRRMSCFELVL